MSILGSPFLYETRGPNAFRTVVHEKKIFEKLIKLFLILPLIGTQMGPVSLFE